MKKILKMFDIFPLNFTFNIKDNQLKKTVGGGISSFLLFITTLALVSYNLFLFFTSNIPLFLTSDNYIGNNRAEVFPLDRINLVNTFIDINFAPIKLEIYGQISLFFLWMFQIIHRV